MNTLAVPNGVKIGSGILYPRLKEFVKPTDRVMMIVDKTVDELYGKDVFECLTAHCRDIKREFVHAGSLREALLMAYYIVNRDLDVVIAMGGGKVLDVGKYASTMSKRPFISIPTSMSHDGVASPMAVLKCDHGEVRTLMAEIPSYIIMDMEIISKAPRKMILAGLGDLISNITALQDWETAVAAGKAQMDDFAYIISGTAVRAILQYTNPSLDDIAFLTQLAESLVLSGLAMNITGNTRPSSGAEHLISHAIDSMGKGTFHGLQAGMASVLVEYLYGGDYKAIRAFLKRFGIPSSFEELGLSYDDYLQAMRMARTTRKNRYTILDEISLEEEHLKEIYDAVYGGHDAGN
ncbi:MAG: iron-containing alcohol dehydrogenase family protein [Christensenella sp.]|nr:iron-containing alcohol dehydrogenase family protein [Christensenella sp.]